MPDDRASGSDEPGRAPGVRAFRVLVIEDNRDAAEMTKELLVLEGHEVHTAHSGEEGIETARRVRPHVVLCDLGLPGKDGYVVARELRLAAETSAATLIAVSGYGTEADQARSREAGFDLHLTKPVDPESLMKLIASNANG